MGEVKGRGTESKRRRKESKIKKKNHKMGGRPVVRLATLAVTWSPPLSLSQSPGTTSSCRRMEREMLGGRAEDSDMWNLSSNADPLCFRVLVFSPPSPQSILFFFSSNSFNTHKFSIFSLLSASLFHFPSLTCDACTPVLLLQ